MNKTNLQQVGVGLARFDPSATLMLGAGQWENQNSKGQTIYLVQKTWSSGPGQR